MELEAMLSVQPVMETTMAMLAVAMVAVGWWLPALYHGAGGYGGYVGGVGG
jgi:hypothetical protein